MARRLLSIWFPRLASDAALRDRPVDGPFALVARAGNADHLHCLNAAASREGLARGMALADARALCPDLSTRPADLAREGAALSTLIRWAVRYSPMVARDGADGIVADITGVAHLFGDEPGLRADLTDRLARSGITAASAIADTRGAAHALARHGGGIIPPGAVAAGLAHLPVAALRLDGATADGLARLGLATIGDLARQPRAPLAKRFGIGLVQRLDQALGTQAEPVAATPDPPHFGVRMTLPDPIGLHADVMAGLDRLLDRLCEKLADHDRGARRLRLDLRRVDRDTSVVEIGLARPMRDPARIARLFDRAVAEVDAGFGIDALRLAAVLTEPLHPRQIASHRDTRDDDMADLISRLGNRLGFDAVQRLAPADSLIPERSFTLHPAAYAADSPPAPSQPQTRPHLIFPPEPILAHGPRPPARFRWRAMAMTTLRATGPERIAPEWWFDDPDWRTGLRDYWRVDTEQGPRLWLFYTPQSPGWCVQGEFT